MLMIDREVDSKATEFVRDVERTKNVLAKLFLDRALTDDSNDEKYYLVSKKLSSLKVKYLNDPTLILATDGDNIYVGPLYGDLRDKYKNKPKVWRRLQVALVLHEVLHVLYGHPIRSRLASDPELYNIVADLFVNTEIERDLGIRIPRSFITIDTFVDELVRKYKNRINPEAVDKIRNLGLKLVNGEISVEEMYNTFLRLDQELQAKTLKEVLGGGFFFGHDLAEKNGKRISPPRGSGGSEGSSGQESSTGSGSSEETEGSGNNKSTSGGSVYPEPYSKKWDLREVQKEISDLLDEIHTSLGELEGIKRGKEDRRTKWGERRIGIGTKEGIWKKSEFRQLKHLSVPIEVLFLREVSDTTSDEYISFIKNSDDAYWLPDIEEEHRSRILAFIDSSPSIPDPDLLLFLSFIVSAINLYDVEYDISVFSVGEVDSIRLNKDNLPLDKIVTKRGYGTTLNDNNADRVRKAIEEGVGLIQILSDFYFIVSPKFREAILDFKRRGGRVSCYSTTKKFADFCDSKVNLPVLPS